MSSGVTLEYMANAASRGLSLLQPFFFSKQGKVLGESAARVH